MRSGESCIEEGVYALVAFELVERVVKEVERLAALHGLAQPRQRHRDPVVRDPPLHLDELRRGVEKGRTC